MKKSRLSDRVSIIFISEIINMLLSAVLSVLLVRLTSKPEYGTYKQVWLVYNTISPVLLFGIPASVSYFVPQLSKKEEEKGFVAQCFLYLLIIGGGFTLGLLLFADQLAAYFRNPSMSSLLGVFGPYPMFALPVVVLPNLLIAQGQGRKAATANLVYKLNTPLAAIVPILLGLGLQGAFCSILIVQIGVFVIATLYILLMYRDVQLSWQRDLIKTQINYSAPIGLTELVATIAKQVDSLIVSLRFSVSQYAVYAVGTFGIPVIRMLCSTMGLVMTPDLVKLYHQGKVDESLNIWHTSIIKLALAAMPLFVYLMVISKPLIVLLYTSEYLESLTLFRLYLILDYPLQIAQYSLFFRVTGNTKSIFWGNNLYLGVKLILTVALVVPFGFVGPALATVIGTFIEALYYLNRLSREVERTFWDIFPWKSVLTILAMSTFVGLIIYPVTLIAGSELTIVVISAGLYGVCFLALAVKFGLITQDDVKLAKDWASLRILYK